MSLKPIFLMYVCARRITLNKSERKNAEWKRRGTNQTNASVYTNISIKFQPYHFHFFPSHKKLFKISFFVLKMVQSSFILDYTSLIITLAKEVLFWPVFASRITQQLLKGFQ